MSKTVDLEQLQAGVPYKDAPRVRRYVYGLTDGKVKGLVYGDVDGEPWISDGYLAHVGAVPDGETAKPAPIQQVIPTRFDREVYPLAYFQTPHTRGASRLVVLNDGAVLNYDMFRFLMKKFPGATLHSNGRMSPIGFKVDGKTVAIMMPFIPNGGVPGAVLAMLEDA